MLRILESTLIGGVMACSVVPVNAANNFYADKTVSLIISAGAGGGYSTYGRTLARHMGNHIPGSPNIVVQNMPGGGGLRATNHLASNAEKDGTVIGLVHTAVVFAPLYGMDAANFDPREFNWLGAMDTAEGLCVAWHSSPIKNWQDLHDKEFVVGGTGAGSQMETMPRLLNSLFGTNIKIVSGYKGGNNVYLAMERGEVHGRCGGLLASIRSTRPDWFPDKKVVVPIQIALERSAQFPNVPAVIEFAQDERTKAILELALSYQDMDRPVFAPPGVPEDRAETLRNAFGATMNDAAFKEEVKAQNLTLNPRSGDRVAKLVKRVYAMPDDIVRAAAKAMSPEES